MSETEIRPIPKNDFLEQDCRHLAKDLTMYWLTQSREKPLSAQETADGYKLFLDTLKKCAQQ